MLNSSNALDFKKVLDSEIETKMNQEGISRYISAIVTNILESGAVDVYLPPDTSNQVTGLLNKTGETLEIGDSVELCTKNGKLKNAWVAVKHGTNNSGGGGGGTSDYSQLENKPQINGNTLVGNKTSAQLGLQSALISGQNIKTINSMSILGEGNIEIKSGDGSVLIWDSETAGSDATVFNLACEKWDSREPFVFLGNFLVPISSETLSHYLVPINICLNPSEEEGQFLTFTTSPIYLGGRYALGGVKLNGTWGNYTSVEIITWSDKMTPATKRDLEDIAISTDHATLSHLDYESSGHTGFASSNQLNALDTKVNNNYTTLDNKINNVNNDLNNYKETTDETLQDLKDRIRVDDDGNLIIDGTVVDWSKIKIDTIDLGNFGFIVNSDESLSFRKVKNT